ncbi:MAG: prepilin-type N-terminal cleavage/methylation domain-containing protein, partial [Candidatus Sericytochromatia bacterium]
MIKVYKKGITLLEIIISISIFSIITVISAQVILDVQSSYSKVTMLNNLKNRDQSALNKIYRKIATSKVFIGRRPGEIPSASGTYSKYYLSRISIPTQKLGDLNISPLSTNVLPQIINNMS